jgi:hypothetical protein
VEHLSEGKVLKDGKHDNKESLGGPVWELKDQERLRKMGIIIYNNNNNNNNNKNNNNNNNNNNNETNEMVRPCGVSGGG